MPLIIGVTGSIATGKSLVCQTLVDLGAVHSDADKLVHRLYDPGTLGFDRIVKVFGPEIVGIDGYINRKELGGKVFGNPEAMRKLTEAIGNIAGAIEGTIEEWRKTLGDDATCVLEAVNHVEAGYGQWTDVTWLVTSSEDTARQRLLDRNNYTTEEANQRLTSQRPWESRVLASDVTVHNDGSVEELVTQVKYEYFYLRKLYEENQLPPSKYYGWWEEQQASRSAE